MNDESLAKVLADLEEMAKGEDGDAEQAPNDSINSWHSGVAFGYRAAALILRVRLGWL